MVSRQQYKAIKESLIPAEKALIKFYELNWVLKHTVPTVEEVTEHLRKDGRPNLRQTSVNYYLTRAPVIKALEVRGIPFRQHTREELTDQQMAAALTVMNMMDTRSIPEKLDSIGILPATYYSWLNDPLFRNFVNGLADQNKLNIRPTAVAEFTKKISEGDWNAIKYWMDVTGEFANDEANMPKAADLMRMLIEIIQKHVKDANVIMAIAEDIKLATANRALQTISQPALESQPVIYDPELEDAKKKLGFA